MIKLTSQRIAGLICVYFIVLAFSYARAIPVFESGDEQGHFLYIHNLLKTKQLPPLLTYAESANASDPVRQWSNENHQPPLYYLGGAVLVAWTLRADIVEYLDSNPLVFMRGIHDNNFNMWLHRPTYPGDTAAAVFILKLYSLTLATATLWFIYLTGKLTFGVKVGLLGMAMVASIPSFVANSISISNDGLVVLLYTAGVYWICRLWNQRAIRPVDIVALSLIAGLIPLSKVTGMTLFAVIYLSLVIGVARQRYPLRQAAALIAASLVAAALLSGWWYVRNWAIYGDPLVVKATQQVWNHTAAQPVPPREFLNEVRGVWDSFWMMIGTLPVRGPDWLYPYAGVISIVACFGLFRAWHRPDYADYRQRRDVLALFAAVCVLMILALVAGTQQIYISYGRILFPAMVAFSILLAVGWLHAFKRKLGTLLLVPLAVVSLNGPASVLPAAYPALDRVESVPHSAHVVNATAEGLTLVAYAIEHQTVSPGGSINVQIYISGQHPDNPALSIKALDPVTNVTRGSTLLYPGMMKIAALAPGTIYRTSVRLHIDSVAPASPPLVPSQLKLLIEWKIPTPERVLAWVDQRGIPLDEVEVAGPTLIDPAYRPPVPQFAADIVYGDGIQLVGYSLSTAAVRPGAALTVTLHWRALKRIEKNWTVGIGLLGHDQQITAQADGMPAGYPTSAWQPGSVFADTHVLTIPATAKPESYALYVTWYNTQNGERLPARGDHVDNNTLYIVPTSIKVVTP